MSDEDTAGAQTPPAVPPASGAFDWLRESHQQTTPLAPLSDDLPPAPAPAASGLPEPASQPSAPAYPDAASPWSLTPTSPAPSAPAAPAPPLFAATQATTSFEPSAPQPPATQPLAPEQTVPQQTAPQQTVPQPAASLPSAPLPASTDPGPPPLQAPPAASQTVNFPTTPPPFTQVPIAEVPAGEPAPSAANQPPTWSAASAPAAPPQPPASIPLPPRPSFLSAHEAASTSVAPTAPALPVVPAAASAPTAVTDASAATPFPFAGLTASTDDATPEALAPTAFGGNGLGLERHQVEKQPGTGPLDWISFVLAIVLPPLGLIVAIVALIVGSRTRGFAAGIAKAALAIAIVLSIGVGVGAVVLNKISNDNAQHNAIAASSQAWCSSLKSNPATLSSPTYGWPAPADTIPDSITSMQAYVTTWANLEKIAPSGIKHGTGQIESAAKSIVAGVNSTQTLDDSSDVATMTSAVSNSGVGAWVAEYCK